MNKYQTLTKIEQKVFAETTDQVTNMVINSMFYNIPRMERIRNELLTKFLMGAINPAEERKLQAYNTIISHHEKGGRISELIK